MELVKVVEREGKLRVTPVDTNKQNRGYVKFPKNLRIKGKVFAVGELTYSLVSGCWNTKGDIYEVITKMKKVK